VGEVSDIFVSVVAVFVPEVDNEVGERPFPAEFEAGFEPVSEAVCVCCAVVALVVVVPFVAPTLSCAPVTEVLVLALPTLVAELLLGGALVGGVGLVTVVAVCDFVASVSVADFASAPAVGGDWFAAAAALLDNRPNTR
jgi:hypothetical protein